MPSASDPSLDDPDRRERRAPPTQPASLRRPAARPAARVVVTPAIVAINVALFVAMVAASGEVVFPPQTLVPGAGCSRRRSADGEWWRLLSPMWLHAHPLHLLLNLVFLWQLGAVVERLLGPLSS